ncbi:MAG: tetratricopeptide repeat protein [Chloroflexota bacterium]
MSNHHGQVAGKASSLPTHLTPFIGRRQELAEIARLLDDEKCRLLTLLGMGGVGKTRLAIEAARQARAQFAGGAAFIPLQNIESPAYLPGALADGLNFARHVTDDPWQQLLSRLRDREMLLVLDNFEHLLEAAPRLTTLLQAAPGITLLVTSREALRLEEEWRFPVQGLSVPDSERATEWESHDALHLLAERARRVRPDFALADELQGAVRLCRLVEGMPLAIELAASWTRNATSEQVADEIAGNLDLLTTTMRNVAGRHRSLRAVFEHTWQQLAEEEQQVFARLSVFRGSFRRQAAAQVTEATLPLLSSLVDKALLRWEPDGRYQMHALLRQYATEQLDRSPQVRDATHERHSTFYATFLDERRPELHRGRQPEALGEIEQELDNIRAAWTWATGRRDVEKLQQAAEALTIFFDFRGRYLEGVRALQSAVDALQEKEQTTRVETTLATLLSLLSGLLIRLGRLDESEDVIERCQSLLEPTGQPGTASYHTDPILIKGIVASIRGDYETVQHLGRQALRNAQDLEQPLRQQAAHYLLARAALQQGEVQLAETHIKQAYELGRQLGDRWFLAYSHTELGNVARMQGRYDEARNHFQESYYIREQFEDPEGMAAALNHLGKVALLQQKVSRAQQLYEQALSISREISNYGGQATALSGLGSVALARDDHDSAQRSLNQALHIARQYRFISLLLDIFVDAGRLLVQSGQKERGLQLLVVALQHPRSEHETVERAREALAPHDIPAPAPATPDWEELEQLARGLERATDQGARDDGDDAQIDPPQLVEPLTEREAEVLKLLAEGLTNAQIAERLVLAIGTVKYYTSEIYGKLAVSNRMQAVNRARELDLL